jgi:hypothetical protein
MCLCFHCADVLIVVVTLASIVVAAIVIGLLTVVSDK